jgi:hypothetical protein
MVLAVRSMLELHRSIQVLELHKVQVLHMELELVLHMVLVHRSMSVLVRSTSSCVACCAWLQAYP